MLLGERVFFGGREAPVWSVLHSLHSSTHPGPGEKKPSAAPLHTLSQPWEGPELSEPRIRVHEAVMEMVPSGSHELGCSRFCHWSLFGVHFLICEIRLFII